MALADLRQLPPRQLVDGKIAGADRRLDAGNSQRKSRGSVLPSTMRESRRKWTRRRRWKCGPDAAARRILEDASTNRCEKAWREAAAGERKADPWFDTLGPKWHRPTPLGTVRN
jgi:hypothetical protein